VIEIRALTEVREFERCVELQRIIWGFSDVELLPVRLFIVVSKIGGQVFGAFDGPAMVAFCVSTPGVKAGGEVFLHSNMLGVLAEHRDTGVGRRLKLAQRDDALARGIGLIEWTFDPLEVKNAFFNMERLGAVVRRYVLNQYGISGSHLHAGLPTDRCIAEWYVGSDRVRTTLERVPVERPAVEARIVVPAAVADWKKSDPRRAREAQAEVSRQFLEHFRSGLAVTGFEKTDEAGTYLLGRWESK